ncbi:DUF6691 family protein [Nitrincola sp. MINF-07-Sa-05]|uniref:DUF6691 family protein n=1 Tax=Nitrincola salilacus TaxID=3400273 RepID=UPI003918190A
MRILIALCSGLIFGFGLILSGMSNPVKVLGFLDLAGQWDPSLALVMVGAIATAIIPFQWVMKRQRTLLETTPQLPTSKQIDKRLLIGSLIFGTGWGIAGFCPGPALVAAGAGMPLAMLFVVAMLAGMGLFTLMDKGLKHA